MTTITIDRALLEQALGALEWIEPSGLTGRGGIEARNKAITALRAALAQQAEAVEPVAWKQGNLVTFNEDPYPALGGLFVQFWDGEEVAARVYANDLETIRQRCAKVNTAPPQRKPLTDEEIDRIRADEREACAQVCEEVDANPHVVLHHAVVCAAAIRARGKEC